MKKLRSWYTIPQAAEKLSAKLSETIAQYDILQYALDGNVSLSVVLNNQPAYKKDHCADDINKSGREFEGIYEIALKESHDLRDRLISSVASEREPIIGPSQFVISDDSGDLWQLMSRDRGIDSIELAIKKEELEKVEEALGTINLSKPVTESERASMLKIIIGMAVARYKYDPTEKRSERVPRILSDLELNGVAVDANTLRKYLKEGAKLLPNADEF